MNRAAGSLPDYSPSLRPSSGVVGFWQRDGAAQKISPATPGDILSAPGVVQFPAATAAILNAHADNWTGANGARTVRISASAAYELRGIAGGIDGRELTLHNVGSFAITLVEEATSSSAANRVVTGGGNFTLGPDVSVRLEYDATSARWRMTAAGTPLPQALGTTDSPSFAGANIGELTITHALYLYNDGTINISADQNDYDLDAVSALPVYRFSTDASRTFTGFVADSFRQIVVVNAGSNPLVLANESASSTAGRRIITGSGGNLTLTAGQAALLWYDFWTSRWRVLAHTSTPSVTSASSFTVATYLKLGQTTDPGSDGTGVRLWCDSSGRLWLTLKDGNVYLVNLDVVNPTPIVDGGSMTIYTGEGIHEEHLYTNPAAGAPVPAYTINFNYGAPPPKNALLRIVSVDGITALTLNFGSTYQFKGPSGSATSDTVTVPTGGSVEYRYVPFFGHWLRVR